MTANPLSALPASGAAVSAGAAPFSRFTPIDPLRFLRQHLMLLIVTTVVGAGLATGAYFLLRTFSPRYTSIAQLTASSTTPRTAEDPMIDTGSISQSGQEIISAFIQTEARRLLSDEVLLAALAKDEVRKTPWFLVEMGGQSDPEGAVLRAKDLMQKGNALKGRTLTAEHVRGSTLMQVSLHGQTEDSLQAVLGTIVQVYLSRKQTDTEQNSTALRAIYVDERRRAEDDVTRYQGQLRKFYQDNDMNSVQNNASMAQIDVTDLTHTRNQLLIKAQDAENRYKTLLTSQAAGSRIYTPEDLETVDQDQAVSSRKERIRLLREERAVLADRFGEQHRTVKEIDLRIAAVEVELKRERERLLKVREEVQLELAKKDAEAMGFALDGLRNRIEEAATKMKDLNAKLLEYKQIETASKNAEERKHMAEKMLDSDRVMGGRPDARPVRVVQGATKAELTSPVVWFTIPAGTALVLLLVVGSVFAKESLDQRIKSPADVRLLPNLELLGVLPAASEDPSGPASIEGVVQKDPTGLMAEAFRQVRAALLARMDRRGYKTLMLVSAQPQAGVSSVISNLALSLASNGRRVLVLDANLRRPAQHRLLGTRAEPGLVDVLRGRTPLDEAVVHQDDLDVLPAGQAADAAPELLEGAAFRGLLSQLESRYDLVLVDAAPALVASDATMLVKHVDAVAVVTRANVEKRGMISRTFRQLEGQRGDLLGVILNGARSSAGGYFRENYQEFYRYRQGNGAGAAAPAKAGV